MKYVFLALLFILTLTSCQTKTNSTMQTEIKNIENFDWLLGKWKRANEAAGKETFENWEKINDTHYAGVGFTMQQQDTISKEILQLKKIDNQWILDVKVPVDAPSTLFIMKSFDESSFSCTNDTLDFPKLIKYWKEGLQMKAIVAGDDMELYFVFDKLTN